MGTLTLAHGPWPQQPCLPPPGSRPHPSKDLLTTPSSLQSRALNNHHTQSTFSSHLTYSSSVSDGLQVSGDVPELLCLLVTVPSRAWSPLKPEFGLSCVPSIHLKFVYSFLITYSLLPPSTHLFTHSFTCWFSCSLTHSFPSSFIPAPSAFSTQGRWDPDRRVTCHSIYKAVSNECLQPQRPHSVLHLLTPFPGPEANV